MWQNNLLKFYMENDVERAIEYSKELIDEHGSILPEKDQTDLKFSLATSIILQGDPETLPTAKEILYEALQYEDPLHQGYIYNNLGMAHWFDFVIRSSQITDPENQLMETIQPLIDNFEDSVYYLKKSIHAFEQFDARFKPLTNDEGVDVDLVTQKLFVDEMFQLQRGTGEVIPKDSKSYDMRENFKNE